MIMLEFLMFDTLLNLVHEVMYLDDIILYYMFSSKIIAKIL